MGPLTFPIKRPGFLKSFSTQPRPRGRQGLMSSPTAHSLFLDPEGCPYLKPNNGNAVEQRISV